MTEIEVKFNPAKDEGDVPAIAQVITVAEELASKVEGEVKAVQLVHDHEAVVEVRTPHDISETLETVEMFAENVLSPEFAVSIEGEPGITCQTTFGDDFPVENACHNRATWLATGKCSCGNVETALLCNYCAADMQGDYEYGLQQEGLPFWCIGVGGCGVPGLKVHFTMM